MSVTRGQFYKWPDTVAFKYMMRELIRAQQYVPPQQPTGTGPEGAVVAAEGNTTTPAAVAETAPARAESWTLDEDANGDLIARHSSGRTVKILTISQGDN